MSKHRIPRKAKKAIPKDTFYCYTPDYVKNKKQDKLFPYWIKTCKFYSHVEGLDGHCSLFKCRVLDQVKVCGYKY